MCLIVLLALLQRKAWDAELDASLKALDEVRPKLSFLT